jgi:hypothetical protein
VDDSDLGQSEAPPAPPSWEAAPNEETPYPPHWLAGLAEVKPGPSADVAFPQRRRHARHFTLFSGGDVSALLPSKYCHS